MDPASGPISATTEERRRRAKGKRMIVYYPPIVMGLLVGTCVVSCLYRFELWLLR